jgi:drug/metabolite transporter (DMT)-like permease
MAYTLSSIIMPNNIFQNWKHSPSIALTALVGVTAVWGVTFLMVQDAIGRMPVMDFLAVRFTVATLVMVLLQPAALRKITRVALLRGVTLGILLGLGYITQTFGLLYAPAAISGFITGMFVVLTPVLSWIILRRKTSRSVWLAVALATIGLGMLSIHGWSIGTGEMLTLVCAVFFACHIVGLGEWASQHDTYSFTVLQIGTVAVISLIAASPGGITLPPDASVWSAIGITAVLATAVAFLVQTWAQSLVAPTRAAVVMTMEPVFAGIFGVFIGGNRMTPVTIVGAICVLVAMLFVQLKSNPSVPLSENSGELTKS